MKSVVFALMKSGEVAGASEACIEDMYGIYDSKSMEPAYPFPNSTAATKKFPPPHILLLPYELFKICYTESFAVDPVKFWM